VLRVNYEQAKYQLQLHLGLLDEARKEWVLGDGFLVSLRPYRGLREKNIHLVMEALLTVGERIHQEPLVDRDLVNTVWSLCSFARIWGLHPTGMLERNGLITPDDAGRLALWVDTVEQTALRLLGGWPPHQAVSHYAEYVVTASWWDNIGFFIPLMQRAVADPDTLPSTAVLRALGKLGVLAKSVLPALYGASQWWDSSDVPCAELTTAEVRNAIAAIEGAGGERLRVSPAEAQPQAPPDRRGG
jgi:hypothetical protein